MGDGETSCKCPHCGEDEHPPHVLKCPATDLVLPLEGRMLDKKFRLIKQIGKGGMASVWLAINTLVDRTVAIKLIRPEVVRRDETVKRFRAEARAAGRIGHPNICDILDLGSSPIGPYIVMEYLRGRSLAQWISDEGPLPAGQAVTIVREALGGLVAAHREGIIHRDLKPENVFIHEPETGDPVVKLMDFGVSKFTDGTGEVQTADGALLGTPEYMSPEQFRGAALADERTDVWAIGAILYRALTGVNAFEGPTIAATLLMVSSEPPRPLHELRDDIPPGLVGIIERCLQKTPDLRYASARALTEALAPFDTGAVPASTEHPPLPSASTSLERAVTRGRTTQEWHDINERRPSRSNRRAVMVIGAITIAGALASWYALQNTGGRGSAEPLAMHTDPAIGADTPLAAGDETSGEATATFGPARTTGSLGDTESSAASPTASTTSAAATEGRSEATTTGPMAGTGAEESGDSDPIGAVASAGEEADTGEGPTPHGRPPADRQPGADDEPPTGDPQADPVDEPVVDPPGTFRFGPLLTLAKPGPIGDHNDARKYCEGLAATRRAGVASWKLAAPSVAAKLTGHTRVKRGSYWTSARWRGKALVVKLPSGSKSSIKAERASARPLCVAKWP